MNLLVCVFSKKKKSVCRLSSWTLSRQLPDHKEMQPDRLSLCGISVHFAVLFMRTRALQVWMESWKKKGCRGRTGVEFRSFYKGGSAQVARKYCFHVSVRRPRLAGSKAAQWKPVSKHHSNNYCSCFKRKREKSALYFRNVLIITHQIQNLHSLYILYIFLIVNMCVFFRSTLFSDCLKQTLLRQRAKKPWSLCCASTCQPEKKSRSKVTRTAEHSQFSHSKLWVFRTTVLNQKLKKEKKKEKS